MAAHEDYGLTVDIDDGIVSLTWELPYRPIKTWIPAEAAGTLATALMWAVWQIEEGDPGV